MNSCGVSRINTTTGSSRSVKFNTAKIGQKSKPNSSNSVVRTQRT